jgi:L-2-hydroxyglutarate oxidase LhgO
MQNILIIGSGVVGLAIAYELSKKKNYNVFVLEKNKIYGQENSIRNSEVIHSGVYYKKNSLKHRFCTEGKNLIYKFCKKYKINFKKCGKLFIATSNLENQYLDTLKINSNQNGLKDTKIITEKNLKKTAPQLKAKKALSSPSAGIFDVKSFMKKLFNLSNYAVYFKQQYKKVTTHI